MNDKPIILIDSSEKRNNLEVLGFSEVSLQDILTLLEKNSIKGICLVCNDLERDWDTFKKHFKVVEAAGGKVLNTLKEVLFIYRFDKWDLPKGHIEKEESKTVAAIREVEEECGIEGLEILNELETTYHVFKWKDEIRLKVTYWFLMKTGFTGKLVPQIEEGITKVVFKNYKDTQEAMKNTYENIKLLF